MSVLKNRRSLSKLEFYHNARKMRRELTELLLHEFGIYSRSNQKSVDPALPDEYYTEIIAEFSRNIRLILRNLMWNITAGNTMYPTSMPEVQSRRQYQNAAIVNCEQLHQEFMYCEDVLPVKASKFLPYVEMIEYEIKLLKGWRKSTNKFEEKIQGKEEKEKKEEQ
jgi:hypothetical protein